MKEETFKQCEKENVRHIVVWVRGIFCTLLQKKKKKERKIIYFAAEKKTGCRILCYSTV